jgi:hypothetical protein
MRFGYLSMALGQATGGLLLGIEGLGKSFALGSADIWNLIETLFNILILKHGFCIFLFIITTICGCIVAHTLTLFCLVFYNAIVSLLERVNKKIGYDLKPEFDSSIEFIKWPIWIHIPCYTCAGNEYKMGEVITDLAVIEDIGNTFSFDYNVRMPRYMKPSIPLGNDALDSLKKSTN